MNDVVDKRSFGQIASLAFVVGTVVGTGIYVKPGLVASLLASPAQVLMVWGLGGLFATSGAWTYSHLARNWPQNGGPYYYLKSVYGQWAASLLLAADIFLARPAAVGALATGIGLVWGVPFYTGLVIAFCCIGLLTAVQLLGARVQGQGQVLLTALQMVPLFAVLLVWSANSSVDQVLLEPVEAKWGAAFLAVIWAYDGWYNITILGGEVKQPGRTFRFSLIGGMAGVTLLYLGLNFVLLDQLGQQGMRGEVVPFALLFQQWDLSWLGTAVKLSLSAALMATLNGTLVCGSRMIVAGAEDGLIHAPVGDDPSAPLPILAFTGWCYGLLFIFGGLPLETNLFDSMSEFTAVVVTLLSALTMTCIFHSKQFSKRVPLSARGAALFYLAIATILVAQIVSESNVLALVAVITVLILGSWLWLARRVPVSAR